MFTVGNTPESPHNLPNEPSLTDRRNVTHNPVVADISHPRFRALHAYLAAVGSVALPIIAILVVALFEGDVPDAMSDATQVVHSFLQRYGKLAPFLLLYLEETGLPIPMPGDVVIMYAGRQLSLALPSLLATWLGLVVCAVLGASNLYVVSRRWGHLLANGRLGTFLDVTPARLTRAEHWFQRWGPWAIIIGRHIIGFRMPITMAAGLFKVPYPVFAASVTVSAAVWVTAFLFLGKKFGGPLERFLALHRGAYTMIPVLLVGGFMAFLLYRLLVSRRDQSQRA